MARIIVADDAGREPPGCSFSRGKIAAGGRPYKIAARTARCRPSGSISALVCGYGGHWLRGIDHQRRGSDPPVRCDPWDLHPAGRLARDAPPPRSPCSRRSRLEIPVRYSSSSWVAGAMTRLTERVYRHPGRDRDQRLRDCSPARGGWRHDSATSPNYDQPVSAGDPCDSRDYHAAEASPRWDRPSRGDRSWWARRSWPHID